MANNDDQLLARLLSAPRVASRQVNVTQQMRDAPLALMNAIGHSDSWAPTERALFNTRHTLNHLGRLRLATFLWGNSVGEAMMLLIMMPLFKVDAAQDVRNIIKDLQSGKNDHRWFYFDTHARLFLYLDGAINTKWTEDYGVAGRIFNYQWGRFINAQLNDGLGYPTFTVKRAFMERHKQEWCVAA